MSLFDSARHRRWPTRCERWPGCCAIPTPRCAQLLPQLRAPCTKSAALDAGRLAELDALMDRLRGIGGLRAEAEYVELFDRGRRTALHLFEHVHGDSRDRGPAMVDLAQTYERAGLLPCSERTARLPAGRAGVRQHAAAGAGARLPARDRPHRACDFQRACWSDRAPTPACWPPCSTSPASAPKKSLFPRTRDRRELGRARSLRRLQLPGPVASERSAARPHRPPRPSAATRGRLRRPP